MSPNPPRLRPLLLTDPLDVRSREGSARAGGWCSRPRFPPRRPSPTARAFPSCPAARAGARSCLRTASSSARSTAPPRPPRPRRRCRPMSWRCPSCARLLRKEAEMLGFSLSLAAAGATDHVAVLTDRVAMPLWDGSSVTVKRYGNGSAAGSLGGPSVFRDMIEVTQASENRIPRPLARLHRLQCLGEILPPGGRGHVYGSRTACWAWRGARP